MVHFLNLFDATQRELSFFDKLWSSRCGLQDRFGPKASRTLGALFEGLLVIRSGLIHPVTPSYPWTVALNLDEMLQERKAKLAAAQQMPTEAGANPGAADAKKAAEGKAGRKPGADGDALVLDAGDGGKQSTERVDGTLLRFLHLLSEDPDRVYESFVNDPVGFLYLFVL